MLRKATSVISFLFLVSLLPTAANAGVPDWFRALAQQPAKTYADDANAVTLLDDQETTVRDNGEIVTHERIAYRILRPEGKSYAGHRVYFDSETRINSFRGWSITAKGLEYEAKEKDAFERSLGGQKEFEDTREKVIVLPGADVGTVVGFEYEQKRRPYLFQDYWDFQATVPVEKSRYTLRVPSRWEYRADWLNHAEQKPTEQNGAWHTVGGKQYGVPYQWGSNVLMYNVKAFNGQAPTSWNVIFQEMTLPDGKSNKGRVQAYIGPIYIADAAPKPTRSERTICTKERICRYGE